MILQLPTEIGLCHVSGHSNHLLVTERELRHSPIVGRDIG
jgi:hypothetical protein